MFSASLFPHVTVAALHGAPSSLARSPTHAIRTPVQPPATCSLGPGVALLTQSLQTMAVMPGVWCDTSRCISFPELRSTPSAAVR
jgi:hypothetical protein